MNHSQEARLLTAVEQAHQHLVLARLETEREHRASARTAKICLALQERLLELEAALRQTEQQRAAESEAAVDRLTRRHAEFTASLADGARARDTLAQQLTLARAMLEQVRKAREADGIAAAEVLRRHQAEFEGALVAAADARAAAEQQLASLQADIQQAEARHASERAADAERLAAHDAVAAASVAQLSDQHDALARQLSASSAALEASQKQRALEEADARATLDQTVEQAARALRESDERHALELTTAASDAVATRAAFEQQLSDAAAALERAEKHRVADAAAAAQQLASLQADIQQAEARHASERAADAERLAAHDAVAAASVAQLSDQHDALARQLSASSAALEASQKQRALDAADAQATLEQTVAQAAATRAAFEQQLSDAAAALERAEEHRVADAAAAAQQLASLQADVQQAEARHASERAADAERRATHDAAVAASVAQLSDQRDSLARQLSASSAAFEASQKQRALAEADARATLEQTVAQAAATREALEQQLSAAAVALERAEAYRAAHAVAAAQHLEERQAEFQGALAAAAAARGAVEQQLESLQADVQQAEARRASEGAADAERRAAHDAAVAANLAQLSEQRDALARQLNASLAVLEESQKQLALEGTAVERLTWREAELLGQLAQEAESRATLERSMEQAARAQREAFDRQLSDAAAALEHAEQRADSERMSASAREQSIQGDLAREVELRTNVEHDLSAVRAEFSRARRRLLSAASALRRRTVEHRTQREAHFAEERADHERRLGERDDTIRHVEAERDTLRQSLVAARGELQVLSDSYDNERIEFKRVQSINESKLQGLAAEYDTARHSLDHLRDAFNTLERVSSEHAIERARLESVVIDRDARMSAQESTHLAADQAGKEALRQAEDMLLQTVERKNSQIGGLERELELFRHDLERARLDGEAENWQQFEHAPHAMCRLTRDGALLATNQAFARVLGYRSTDDLGKPDLTTAVFEAPADLHWLIERAVGGGALAAIETVWKKNDGTRLVVRLQVVRTKEEWLEVAAEDITLLRTTEENLRQARRMEAVGRLASEVAVTCDTLLRGVSHGGQYWLAAIGSDLALRRQGEQLLGDVAHATSLLQRLAAYGNEQIDALQPVDLQRVLRNLEPVLQRVAGDDIEVVLPKHIGPFSVDVERTRVERVLVNVASYARERMPHGGRLKIDLAAAVVDRTFLDKYPNVRPGPHVIATVTEERCTTPTSLPGTGPAPSGDDSRTSAGEKPGVDLSALLRLLGDCGGHLWVAAEPPGNMTLKIHLPLCASDDATSPSGWFARAGVGRSLGRWSRH